MHLQHRQGAERTQNSVCGTAAAPESPRCRELYAYPPPKYPIVATLKKIRKYLQVGFVVRCTVRRS